MGRPDRRHPRHRRDARRRGQLLEPIRTYPALVDGAFVIIAWVGIKLLVDYAHAMHWIGWEIPRVLSMGIIAVIFIGADLDARALWARRGAG